MSTGQSTSVAAERLRAGPQGTQILSADELQQLNRMGSFAEERASVDRPVLSGLSDGLRDQRFALRQGRQTVGRRQDNDIIFEDSSVSAAHAWIILQQTQCVVMNTLSTNGTFVNGKRVHQATLKHGDRVRFGQVELRYLTREPGLYTGPIFAWGIGVIAAALATAGAWWLF